MNATLNLRVPYAMGFVSYTEYTFTWWRNIAKLLFAACNCECERGFSSGVVNRFSELDKSRIRNRRVEGNSPCLG